MPLYNMVVVNELRKEFFRLLKKNFLPSSNLYKIFNKKTIKLSYSYMPNVENLINKSNTKYSGINDTLSPLNATALIRPFVP